MQSFTLRRKKEGKKAHSKIKKGPNSKFLLSGIRREEKKDGNGKRRWGGEGKKGMEEEK